MSVMQQCRSIANGIVNAEIGWVSPYLLLGKSSKCFAKNADDMVLFESLWIAICRYPIPTLRH